MKLSKKFRILPLVIIFGLSLFLLRAATVSAAGILPPCVTYGDCTICDMLNTAIQIGVFVIGIVGSLVLLMFVFGGFMMLTSGGASDKIKKGKDILINAVIGLAIVFLAYTVVLAVVNAVSGKPFSINSTLKCAPITAPEITGSLQQGGPTGNATGSVQPGGICDPTVSGVCTASYSCLKEGDNYICKKNTTACATQTAPDACNSNGACIWKKDGVCLPKDPNNTAVSCEALLEDACVITASCNWQSEGCARIMTAIGGNPGSNCTFDSECGAGYLCVAGVCAGGSGDCKNKKDWTAIGSAHYCLGGTEYECELFSNTLASCDVTQKNDICCPFVDQACSTDPSTTDECRKSGDSRIEADAQCLNGTSVKANFTTIMDGSDKKYCLNGRVVDCQDEGEACDSADIGDLCCPGLVCDVHGFNKCLKNK